MASRLRYQFLRILHDKDGHWAIEVCKVKGLVKGKLY